MSDNKTIAKSVKEPVLVAVDDGYAMTKIVTVDGKQFKFPSLMRPGPAGLSGSSKEIPSYWTNDGGGEKGAQGLFTATTSSDIDASDTQFDTYAYGPLNRVMIHHALRHAGFAGQAIQIATSLPVGKYYGVDSVNQDIVALKNASVMMPVRAVDGEPCAQIKVAKVFAEGVSAWIDYAIADNGDSRVVLDSPAAVIDIGGRTTDTVKVLAALTIEKKSSGTINMGVLDLIKALRQKISRHPKISELFGDLGDAEVPRSMVEEVLRTGRFKRHRLDIDMSEEIAQVRRPIANEILQDVERRIGKGFDLQELLFVGGGSVIFKEEIKAKFGLAVFAEDPEFANARGMMKFMKYV